MSETQSPGDVDKREPQLTPTSHGEVPGTPLYDYFAGRLPADLPRELYEGGIGCFGFARLILGELGGPQAARIYEIRRQTDSPEDPITHGFVVPLNADPDEPAYNNNLRVLMEDKPLSNRQVIEEGVDVTDEILASPWEEL